MPGTDGGKPIRIRPDGGQGVTIVMIHDGLSFEIDETEQRYWSKNTENSEQHRRRKLTITSTLTSGGDSTNLRKLA